VKTRDDLMRSIATENLANMRANANGLL